MPKDVRTTIRTLANQFGKSRAWIAKELNLPWKTVDFWVKADGVEDKPRRAKPISDRETRLVKRNMAKGATLREEGRRINRSASFVHKKVRKSVENKDGLFPYKSVYEIELSRRDKERRVAFANSFPYDDDELMMNELKLKYWYDEKKWELGKPPNKQNVRYWQRPPRRRGIGYYPQYTHLQQLSIAVKLFAGTVNPNYVGMLIECHINQVRTCNST